MNDIRNSWGLTEEEIDTITADLREDKLIKLQGINLCQEAKSGDSKNERKRIWEHRQRRSV